MKVLLVNNHHRIIGGSDSVYFNTGDLLVDRGHEVGWFAGADRDDLPSADEEYFTSAIDMRAPRIFDLPRYFHNGAASRALGYMLSKRGDFDVAHLHIYYGRLTASILSPLRARNIPIVQSLHEYKLACPVYTMERAGSVCHDCVTGSTLNVIRHRCKGTLLSSLVAYSEFHASRLQGDVSKVDRFICVSDFQRTLLARAGIPEEKMVTLHNFVDVSKLSPDDSGARGDYLLYLGRIEKLKGLPTLIEAARETGQPLRIAGTGSWLKEMEAEIANVPNIEYLGFVSGTPLRSLVAAAKGVVVPSEWYENCPMSVLEAKAASTPVIGARIGGIPELVQSGVDGFLFNPGDSADLARAIESLCASDSDALGAAARADVERRFSPQVHYAALMDIYAAAGL